MILVTGGSGLLGSHLLLALSKKDEKIRALKRNGSNIKLVEQLFNYYEPANGKKLYSKIEWIEGDVNDIISLEDAFENIDYVYHCAAVVSFDSKDYQRIDKINREGTANVVNCCLDAGIKKLCHVSSTAAIGRTKESEIITEKNNWKNTPENSWYAISKYNAEREVWRGIEEGLNAVIVNPCIILGPSDWNSSSSSLFQTASKGLKYYTEGGNAFVDVRDVVSCMMLLMEKNISAERFLVTSENLKFKTVFELISKAFEKPVPYKKVSPRLSSFAWRFEKFRTTLFGGKARITKETARAAHKTYQYDNSKIKKELRIEFISVEDSIKDAAKYFKSLASINSAS